MLLYVYFTAHNPATHFESFTHAAASRWRITGNSTDGARVAFLVTHWSQVPIAGWPRQGMLEGGDSEVHQRHTRRNTRREGDKQGSVHVGEGGGNIELSKFL